MPVGQGNSPGGYDNSKKHAENSFKAVLRPAVPESHVDARRGIGALPCRHGHGHPEPWFPLRPFQQDPGARVRTWLGGMPVKYGTGVVVQAHYSCHLWLVRAMVPIRTLVRVAFSPVSQWCSSTRSQTWSSALRLSTLRHVAVPLTIGSTSRARVSPIN